MKCVFTFLWGGGGRQMDQMLQLNQLSLHTLAASSRENPEPGIK